MKSLSALLAFIAIGHVSCLQDESTSANNSQSELSSSSLSSSMMSSTALSSSNNSSSKISSSTAPSSSAYVDSCAQEFDKWLAAVQPHDTVFHTSFNTHLDSLLQIENWAKQLLSTLDSAEKSNPSSWPNLKIAVSKAYNVQTVWFLSMSDIPLKTATFTCTKPDYSRTDFLLFDLNGKVVYQNKRTFHSHFASYNGSYSYKTDSTFSHKNKLTFINTIYDSNLMGSNTILLDTNTVYQQH